MLKYFILSVCMCVCVCRFYNFVFFFEKKNSLMVFENARNERNKNSRRTTEDEHKLKTVDWRLKIGDCRL